MQERKPIELSFDDHMQLDRIISTLLRKIEFIEESRIKPPNADKLTDYEHAHDVLEMHNCRHNPSMRDLLLRTPQQWRTELDVPLDEYHRAIDLVIDLLTQAHHRQITETTPTRIQRYNDQITVLRRLKDYRDASVSVH